MISLIDEVLDAIEEGERAGRFRVVFWTCPKGCRGLVAWTKTDNGKTRPKCSYCGEEGGAR